MREVETEVQIDYDGADWLIHGFYWPAYRAPREYGHPLEPDEDETFEVTEVFIVHNGAFVPVPFDVIHQEALDEMGAEALAAYKERDMALRVDRYWNERKEVREDG